MPRIESLEGAAKVNDVARAGEHGVRAPFVRLEATATASPARALAIVSFALALIAWNV
jgi:hypothetical protein